MFIFNLKFNKKFFIKICVSIIIFLFISMIFFSFIKIKNNSKNLNNSINSSDSNILKINTENFTTFLSDCHDNIPNYLNKRIYISGYIYRMNDFNKDQFVVARTMLINDSKNSLIVGILCTYDKAYEFADYDWVELTGIIEEGYYNGKLPCIKVETLNKIKPPDNSYVKEPID